MRSGRGRHPVASTGRPRLPVGHVYSVPNVYLETAASHGRMAFDPQDNVFLLAGPVKMHPRVLQAMAVPAINHRGGEFKEVNRELHTLLKYLFQTQGEVALISGSGTAGLESAVSSLLHQYHPGVLRIEILKPHYPHILKVKPIINKLQPHQDNCPGHHFSKFPLGNFSHYLLSHIRPGQRQD